MCWQGGRWGRSARDSRVMAFQLVGQPTKAAFSLLQGPGLGFRSDTSIRSPQSNETAGGRAQRFPVRRDGARRGFREARRVRGGGSAWPPTQGQ